MEAIGWSIFTVPETASDGGRVCGDLSGWPSVFDVTKSSSRTVQAYAKHESSPVNAYTSLNEVDDRLNSSTESLPDWEKLSDSNQEFDEEQRCQSLPECNQSKTIWYARLDSSPEPKDLTLKNKVISAWTNVTNGWVLRTGTSFKCDSQIWLLGRKYLCHRLSQERTNKSIIDLFKLDFASRIWLTYRVDFASLPGSQLTSDVGWGCMLRSGQMMLAQALVLHFLCRDWTLSSDIENEPLHRQIIRYFGDFFSSDCPFSIHKLIQISNGLGRQTGDWFGPASISVVLREALKQASNCSHPELSQLAIYVTLDCTVYKQDVIDICTNSGSWLTSCDVSPSTFSATLPDASSASTSSVTQLLYSTGNLSAIEDTSCAMNTLSSSACPEQDLARGSSSLDSNWRSLIILIPLRLGSETMNTAYIPCIKKILESDLCIGIIGGRPKHSLYFIGWQDDKLIYLDPHCCQKTVDVMSNSFPVKTFHCSFPRKLSISKMDPTCAIGFYCKTQRDYDRLLQEVPMMTVIPPLENSPLFTVHEGRKADAESGCVYSMDTVTALQNSVI